MWRGILKRILHLWEMWHDRREFAYDNELMELVRHTIEFIKSKPYGNSLLFR